MTNESMYTEMILEYYKNPINFGKPKTFHLAAHGGNISCGDTADLYITFKGDAVKDISFTGNGCAISRAGLCVLTEYAKGKTVNELLALDPNVIFSELGGVIQTRLKCSLLGLNVLKSGLTAWKKKKGAKLVVKDISI